MSNTHIFPYALPATLIIQKRNGCTVLINAPYSWNDSIKEVGGRRSSSDRGWVLPRKVDVNSILKPNLPNDICCRKAYDIEPNKDSFKCFDNCEKFKSIQEYKTKEAEIKKKRESMYRVDVRVYEGCYRMFEHDTYTKYYETLEDAKEYISSLQLGKWIKGRAISRKIESASILFNGQNIPI